MISDLPHYEISEFIKVSVNGDKDYEHSRKYYKKNKKNSYN